MTDCPSCRRELPDGASFCPACGAEVAGAAPEDTDATQLIGSVVVRGVDERATGPMETQATEPIEAGATQVVDATTQLAATQVMRPPASSWVCPGCGAEAPADDAFCARCGAARPEEPTTVLPAASGACAACGAPLQGEMPFCPHCGARRGELETAASREETMVARGAATDVTQVAAPAFASGAPAPTVPPLRPDQQPAEATAVEPRSHRGRLAVIAALAVFVLAVAAVCVWWFVLRDTGPAARQAFVEQAAPILTPVGTAQAGVDRAVAGLGPLAARSFLDSQAATKAFTTWMTGFNAAAVKLADTLKTARSQIDALSVGEKARPLLDQVKAALAAHADYDSTLAALGSDPAKLTLGATSAIAVRETAARTAYATLAASAPGLPRVELPANVDQGLAALAARIDALARADAARKAYLQQVAGLFGQTRGARETAEGVLNEFLNTQVPADNAAGQMQGAGADLRAALTQVDALAPPADQADQQIQNDYHAAVAHWTAAAGLYAKWMSTVWGYYQAMGGYPQPGQPLEADLFLDPHYKAAQKEQEQADQTRAKLATDYDAQAAKLGLRADFDATSM